MARFHSALEQLMRQEEGAPRERPAEPEHTGTIVSELRARVATAEFALIAPFAEVFLRNSRILEGTLTLGDIAGLTLGACRFLCDRHSSPFTLRSYHPTADEHGWQTPHLVVDIAAHDQPSLISALCEVVEQQGAAVEVLLSAVVAVERDDTGLARNIQPQSGAGDECLVHLQLSGVANPKDIENILRRRLTVLDRTHRDFGALREHLLRLSGRLRQGGEDDREAGEFLAWLADGRMVLAGYQEVAADDKQPLAATGLYADSEQAPIPLWRDVVSASSVSSTKTRLADPTRPGEFLDEIRIRPTGAAVSDPLAYRIVGGLTGQAFRDSTSGIPLARRICEEVLATVNTGDGRLAPDEARAIFDGLPIDLVLSTPHAHLAEIMRVVQRAHSQSSLRIHLAPCGSATDAVCSVTIAVPRGHLVRQGTEDLSGIFRDRVAPILARHVVSDDLTVSRVHFILDRDATTVPPELIEELTAQIRKALSTQRDAPVGERPVSQSAVQAVPVPQASQRSAEEDRQAEIEIEPDPGYGHRFLLRLTARRETGALHELLRVLDGLGLRLLSLSTRQVAERTEVHEFSVETATGGAFDPGRLADTLGAVRARNIENDSLNSLSWRTEAGAQLIEVLRAFSALWAFRGGGSRTALHEVIVSNADAAAAFLRAFAAKFDPRIPTAGDGQRKRELTGAREAFDAACSRVDDASARTALFELGRLLDCAVRTSFYCGDRNQLGRPLALKLEFPDFATAPLQTFVYHVAFEGYLWRGGLAARSMLRMFDSVDTLAAAAVTEIAREGIRAGHLSTDPGSAGFAIRKRTGSEVDRALSSFLHALFDVCDNVTRGELERNAAVVAYDEADPYLSLLIDERPTGFADIARQIVHERGFWMGDAAVARFDHRVAAEGAWIGMQATLPASSSDEAALTTIAIGAPHEIHLPPGLRLVAAFDRHEIFLDPLSDKASSAAALARLSRQANASWGDFPIDCRGRGSAVLNRDARKVELSEEVRSFLGLSEGTADGEGVVRAILAAAVDLLWNRSSLVRVTSAYEEENQPPDKLTVGVSGVAAQVVAEVGYDLFTPQARVEFSLRGGMIHSAASDALAADLIADRVSNVDLALHLGGARLNDVDVQPSAMAADIRAAVMAAISRRSRSIAFEMRRSREQWPSFTDCISALRESGETLALDRHVGPGVELARRPGKASGLTRPEIVALQSTVLCRLKSVIRGSSLAEDPYVRAWVDTYFPAALALQLPELIDEHPLRLDVAALAVASRVIEVMGCTFANDTAVIHGCSEIEVVKAWCAAFIFGGAQEVLADIEASGVAPGSTSEQLHRLEMESSLRCATSRLLDLHTSELTLDKLVHRFAAAAGEILRGWPDLLPGPLRAAHDEAVAAGIQLGLTTIAADHLARVRHLADVVDICDLAIQINSPRNTVATAFLGLDPLFRFSEIESLIDSVQRQDAHWGLRAAAHLRGRLCAARRNLTADVVSGAAGRKEAITRFADTREGDIEAMERLLGEVKSRGNTSIAAVEVLVAGLENSSRRPGRIW